MTEKKIRVVRLMEYIYPDMETALRDQANWAVQQERGFGGKKATVIRSTTLPAEIWEEADPVTQQLSSYLEDPDGLLGTVEPKYRSSGAWCMIKEIDIMDPDGWRNEGMSWYELIDEETFDRLAGASTIRRL